jgi:hypothetical protein
MYPFPIPSLHKIKRFIVALPTKLFPVPTKSNVRRIQSLEAEDAGISIGLYVHIDSLVPEMQLMGLTWIRRISQIGATDSLLRP